MAKDHERAKARFDRWVILPTSAAAVASVLASSLSRSVFDASVVRTGKLSPSDIVAVVAAILGALGALIFSWYTKERGQDIGL